MSDKSKKQVTFLEKGSYALYFLGQNIFYMLIYLYMNTYFTDVGISTMAVAVIALIVKVWDAVNDPIFGGLIDKIKFKHGKFVPWLRIAVYIVFAATVMMFAIPNSFNMGFKIAWAVVAYLLWSVGYTLNDVPIFGLITTITDNQNERTSLNAIGRVSAMIAVLAVMIVIPMFRNAIGGWTQTVLLLSIIAVITMVPIGFTAKERVIPEGKSESVSVKQMMKYLVSNKYLFIYYLAFLISGTCNIASTWGLYIARYCVGNEAIMTVTSIAGMVPAIIIGMFVPLICRKVDKFKLYYIATIVTLFATVAKWIVGYSNINAYIAMSIVVALPAAFTSILMYMFTPDCAEYGCYKTGTSAPGITFATQTFFAKMQSALVSSFGAFILGLIGFVEGADAVQAEGFDKVLWNTSNIAPIVGTIIALVVLHFYKLNDHDVQLMAKVNSGEITREEAEAQMKNKY